MVMFIDILLFFFNFFNKKTTKKSARVAVKKIPSRAVDRKQYFFLGGPNLDVYVWSAGFNTTRAGITGLCLIDVVCKCHPQHQVITEYMAQAGSAMFIFSVASSVRMSCLSIIILIPTYFI